MEASSKLSPALAEASDAALMAVYHGQHRGAGRYRRCRSGSKPLEPRSAAHGALRRDCGEMARRRCHVPLPRAGEGGACGSEQVDGAEEVGLPPAHVGLHAGPVLFQEGDYFGRTVNIAARIADYAKPGEVVVSRAVVDSARGEPVAFEEIGPVELEGVSGAIDLFRASHPG